MKKLMVVAALAALATGCASTCRNEGGNSLLRPGVVRDGMHLKYEVGQNRVSGSEQINCLFGFITWGGSGNICDQSESGFGGKAAVRDGAYANACTAANCDQLVGARYSIYKKDWFVFARYSAEVTGFPAKVVSVDVVDGLEHPIKEESSSSSENSLFSTFRRFLPF